MKFEIFEKGGEYFFQLKAGNGRILLVSVAFTSKAICIKALNEMQKSARDGSRYERKPNGQKVQLYVVDGQGKILASGSRYSSISSYFQALHTISTFCSLAPIFERGRLPQ